MRAADGTKERGQADVRLKAPENAFPNFSRFSLLKSLKTTKESFGKIWRARFGAPDKKRIFWSANLRSRRPFTESKDFPNFRDALSDHAGAGEVV